jgi:hypothetical protein
MFFGVVLVSVLLVIIVLGLVILWIVLCAPGRREHKHAIFVVANPQTIWDNYFTHVKGSNYQPGRRLLSSEILSHDPLTVRQTWQHDFASKPGSFTGNYEIYEPYTRYRLRGIFDDPSTEASDCEDSADADGENGADSGCKNNADSSSEEGADSPTVIYEEGELQQETVGTWLRFTVTTPGKLRGQLWPQWLARRHTERNLRALKDVCEGRRPEAPRSAFSPLRAWQWGLICVGYGALLLGIYLHTPLLLLLTLPMVAIVLAHWADWVMRLCAVPTFKRASSSPSQAMTT